MVLDFRILKISYSRMFFRNVVPHCPSTPNMSLGLFAVCGTLLVFYIEALLIVMRFLLITHLTLPFQMLLQTI